MKGRGFPVVSVQSTVQNVIGRIFHDRTKGSSSTQTLKAPVDPIRGMVRRGLMLLTLERVPTGKK